MGKNKTDPILSVLRHEFRSLSYAIVNPEPEITYDDITNQPRKQFVEYVEAAVSELKARQAKKGSQAPIMKTHRTIFKREHFVLVENVTKVDGKKMSPAVPFRRLQTEGGEHSHYQQQRVYMNHTTRHPSLQSVQPDFIFYKFGASSTMYQTNWATFLSNFSVFK